MRIEVRIRKEGEPGITKIEPTTQNLETYLHPKHLQRIEENPYGQNSVFELDRAFHSAGWRAAYQHWQYEGGSRRRCILITHKSMSVQSSTQPHTKGHVLHETGSWLRTSSLFSQSRYQWTLNLGESSSRRVHVRQAWYFYSNMLFGQGNSSTLTCETTALSWHSREVHQM